MQNEINTVRETFAFNLCMDQGLILWNLSLGKLLEMRQTSSYENFRDFDVKQLLSDINPQDCFLVIRISFFY